MLFNAIFSSFSIVSQLPASSQLMLRHLLCLLYHISGNAVMNMMTSYNLAVCWGQSLLWPPKNKENTDQAWLGIQMKDRERVVTVVKHLIDATVKVGLVKYFHIDMKLVLFCSFLKINFPRFLIEFYPK